MKLRMLRKLLLPLALAGLSAATPAAAQSVSGEQWLAHVRKDLLPFWSSKDALGDPPGAFPTFRCNDGTRFDAAAPCAELQNPPDWIKSELGRNYLRMQGRQTFAYGVAFHLTGERRWLDAARAGAAFTLAQRDPAGGYPSWLENGKPMPEESARTAQDQSYNVVGLAMLFYLTRDPQLERALVAQQAYVFERFWNADTGMLRWVPTEGPPEEAQRKELVAQLDQLNAYMLLVTPYLSEPARSTWRRDIRRLCDLMLAHYYDKETGRFFGTLDQLDSRQPGGRHNDFGHTIKTYWMLLLAARELGDAKLEAFAREGARKQLAAAWDPQSQAWGSAWTATGINPDKSWWIYAELDQVASTLALEDRSQANYLKTSWPFWLKYLTDHKNGEIYGGVRRDGEGWPNPIKIHHWKNGFHSFEHALVSYLSAQNQAGKPATLYFATGDRRADFRPYVLPGRVLKVEVRDGVEKVRFRVGASR
ncbi:hypothetical protein [Niveibacterium sp. SC-1]|uniref:hypothetical protein n=1 Tax=Niveibacterium sp. SC-1 TaxID=3135646 RepID=UPI00311D4872